MKESIDYHKRQFLTPYRSTVAFDKFISKYVDMGGKGA